MSLVGIHISGKIKLFRLLSNNTKFLIVCQQAIIQSLEMSWGLHNKKGDSKPII